MLVVGAALGIVMRFLRPGEIVIDYLPSDATLVDRVRVLADNATLTHVTSLFGALGLLMLLFGLFTIRRAFVGQTSADAFIRFGVMLLTFAVFGFAAANGLNHVIAHVINHGAERGTDLRTLIAHAIDIQTVKAGILIIAGYGYVLGFAGVSLGLSLRFPSGLYRYVASFFILVSLAALAVLIVGDHFHDLTVFYTISKYFSIPLNFWALALGIALYLGHPTLTQEQSA